jgi:hypothetical protein
LYDGWIGRPKGLEKRPILLSLSQKTGGKLTEETFIYAWKASTRKQKSFQDEHYLRPNPYRSDTWYDHPPYEALAYLVEA